MKRLPFQAQGTLGAKAAGGKSFLACSRNRLGPGRQRGKRRSEEREAGPLPPPPLLPPPRGASGPGKDCEVHSEAA